MLNIGVSPQQQPNVEQDTREQKKTSVTAMRVKSGVRAGWYAAGIPDYFFYDNTDIFLRS